MDFAKFVSTLENKGLFFPRVSCLEDKHEGSHPYGNIDFYKEMYKKIKEINPEMYKSLQELDKILSVTGKIATDWTYINSWHINKSESVAMWKLYSRNTDSIAIKSTYSLLRESLNNSEENVYIGKVAYIDFRKYKKIRDQLKPFSLKDHSFSHERELRAVIQKIPIGNIKTLKEIVPAKGDEGLWISVDLDKLIESVYVSPGSNNSFKELVSKILKKYALNKPICSSFHDKDPNYS